MRTILLLLAACTAAAQQPETSEDRRVERPRGYHIVHRTARTGETPPEIKQEKAEEDRRRYRNNTDISNQTLPTREPELKPADAKP